MSLHRHHESLAMSQEHVHEECYDQNEWYFFFSRLLNYTIFNVEVGKPCSSSPTMAHGIDSYHMTFVLSHVV